jgi:hypothetical protein
MPLIPSVCVRFRDQKATLRSIQTRIPIHLITYLINFWELSSLIRNNQYGFYPDHSLSAILPNPLKIHNSLYKKIKKVYMAPLLDISYFSEKLLTRPDDGDNRNLIFN